MNTAPERRICATCGFPVTKGKSKIVLPNTARGSRLFIHRDRGDCTQLLRARLEEFTGVDVTKFIIRAAIRGESDVEAVEKHTGIKRIRSA